MSESDSRLRSQPAPSSLRHETRNNARAISTILSRGSREIESRKKFRGRPPKERVKKCARARRTSVALHSGALGETRGSDIYYYVHIFSLLVLDDRRAMVVSPFLYAMSEERERTTLSRVVHTRTPDIVGEIENNNNGDGEKKKRQKTRYFLIRNSRAHDMQISRRRPFLYVLLFVICFCVHPCNAIALQSRC